MDSRIPDLSYREAGSELDEKELIARRPPWWWMPLPGALAITCFSIYAVLPFGGSEGAFLIGAQLVLVIIGFGMACFISNLRGFARAIWIVLYLLSFFPSLFVMVVDFACRYDNNCL